MMENVLETVLLSSLDKVFYSQRLETPPFRRVAAARGETAAFQIAVRVAPGPGAPEFAHVRLEAPPAPEGCEVTMRAVGHVACTRPANDGDPFILTAEPGLFPDPLLPRAEVWMRPGYWQSFWIGFRPGESAPAGVYTLAFRLVCKNEGTVTEQTVEAEAEVLGYALPPQRLKCIMWFYADCLQRLYGVEAWSERHWEILGHYFRDRAAHGVNCLLTPLWSVPLDTAVGGERPTCQLLRILCEVGAYRFDFSRLDRWIALARDGGINTFEMSHAYTQWGAAHAPKIVAEVDGEERRIFGWETDAHGEEYRGFLRQLMAALLPFLRSRGVTPANCYFHISDEPSASHIESYAKAVGFLRPLLEGYPVIDALSHVEFFQRGLADRPIPMTNALAKFMGETVAERWVYYCGNWDDGVPNRKLGMPSWRNRVLGVLLYWLKVDGFLNWGYNFWFSRDSLDLDLDPWHDTCAGGDFGGGGSYVVYPGHDGRPVSSVTYEVFAEALQDVRALDQLERLSGRERVLDAIRSTLPEGFGDLSMTHYPHEREWIWKVRKAVDAAIAAAV